MISTSHSVSIFLPSAEAWVGNQSISRPSAIPHAEAIAPMTSSGTRWLRPDFSSRMRAASYATRAAEGTAAAAGSGRARQAAAGRRRSGVMPVAEGLAVGTEGGGREALMAAERLGELGGLAVPDPARDLAHGQAAAREQLGRALHPDAREVLAERGVADLGVGALELAARGRDAAGDVVERQVRGVLRLDDLGGIVEEARPETDGVRALDGQATDTALRAERATPPPSWRVAARLPPRRVACKIAAIVASG